MFHPLRAITPLAFGFIIGCVLSLAVFPLIRQQIVSNGHCLERSSIGKDKFEAIIHPPLPSSNRKRSVNEKKAKVTRPRFYATELNIKDKLFVAVITSPNTIGTLGVAINKTASHHVSKMVFFSDNVLSSREADQLKMNLIGLKMKSNDKIFHVLEYIVNKKLVNNYDWFFIIPDNVYVKAFKLHELVTHMSIGKHVLMGTKDDNQPKWCSLASGVLISQEVVKKIIDQWELCRNFIRSDLDQSANFGLCTDKGLNLTCIDEHNGKFFKSWKLESDETLENDLDNLRHEDLFQTSLTVHPLNQESSFYHLHKHYCQLELEQLSQWTENIKTTIHNLSLATPEGPSWPPGLSHHWHPNNRYEVFKWDFFTENEIFKNEPTTNVRSLEGMDKKDIDDVIMFAKQLISAKNANNPLTFDSLLSGYRLFDPTRGMDYIVDMIYKDSNNNQVIRRIHLVRPLTRAEIIHDVPYVTEDTNLTIVLPVSTSDIEATHSFLSRFARQCSDQSDKRHTRLIVTLVQLIGEENEQKDALFSSVIRDVKITKEKCRSGNSHFSILHIPLNRFYTPFAVMDAVIDRFGQDHLYLLVSPWVELHRDFLNRVRMNTIRNFQIFLPIPFVAYHPKISKLKTDKLDQIENITPPISWSDYLSANALNTKQKPIEIHKDFGHFDSQDFGIVGFYGSDYVQTRERVLPIANGKFKNDIGCLFLKNKKIHIMRATDPALTVRFHQKICDPSLEDASYGRCLISRRGGLASKAQLASLILMQNFATKDE